MLISKLERIGIGGKFLLWLCDFLRERTQRVRINECHSDRVTVTSGVPQGSVLGPLLFLVYVNDLPDVLPCTIKLFADDTKVINVTKGFVDEDALHSALDKLNDWSVTNRLPFSAAKCKIVRFSRNQVANMRRPFYMGDYVIDFAHEERDIGVLLMTNLNPSRR